MGCSEKRSAAERKRVVPKTMTVHVSASGRMRCGVERTAVFVIGQIPNLVWNRFHCYLLLVEGG
jgi:hypothetical protein